MKAQSDRIPRLSGSRPRAAPGKLNSSCARNRGARHNRFASDEKT